MKEKMVSFPAAFKLFFTHYVDFTGRSTRAAYWWWQLWELLIGIVIIGGLGGVGFYAISNAGKVSPMIWVVLAVLVIALIAWGFGTLVPGYSLLVRRFRDAGVSPYFVIATRGLPMVLGQWYSYKAGSKVGFTSTTPKFMHWLESGEGLHDGIILAVIVVLGIFEFVVTVLPTKHRPDDDF